MESSLLKFPLSRLSKYEARSLNTMQVVFPVPSNNNDDDDNNKNSISHPPLIVRANIAKINTNATKILTRTTHDNS